MYYLRKPIMTKSNNRFAIVVHACDRYEFLFQGFATFFNEFWDKNIDAAVYLVSEDKKIQIHGFTNIQSGRGEWSDRLIKVLSQDIQEDYIIYMQEDMWLNAPVDVNFFNELFTLTIAENWKIVKLHSSELYKTQPTGKSICGFEIAILNNLESRYLMSHQITLWNKQFLLQQLLPGEHPWRNERRATKRMKTNMPVIHHVDYFSENGKAPINQNARNIIRSGYNTISVNASLNSNVLPFIEKLRTMNPSNSEYADQLQFHYTHEITHDGKDKPRKDGIFKKIKLLFTGK